MLSWTFIVNSRLLDSKPESKLVANTFSSQLRLKAFSTIQYPIYNDNHSTFNLQYPSNQKSMLNISTWPCDWCGKKFGTYNGMKLHQNRWCSKQGDVGLHHHCRCGVSPPTNQTTDICGLNWLLAGCLVAAPHKNKLLGQPQLYTCSSSTSLYK